MDVHLQGKFQFADEIVKQREEKSFERNLQRVQLFFYVV